MKKYFFIAVIFYIICTCLLTYPLVTDLANNNSGGNRIFAISSADNYLMIWTMAWEARQLTKDPLHLFDANYFYPHQSTLALSEHYLGSGILALPIIKIIDNPVLALNILVLFFLVLGALGAFMVTWELTNNFFCSLLSGILFGFAPYRMGHLQHLHLLAAIFPLAIFFLIRYIKYKKNRHLIGFAIFTFWQCLASWHLGLFAYLLIILFLLFSKIAAYCKISNREILRITGALFLVGLFLIPLYIPFFLAPEKLPVVTLNQLLYYSPRILDYLTVTPYLISLFGQFPSSERLTYYGLSTSILLLTLVIFALRRPKIYAKDAKILAILGCLVVIFGLLSFGPLIRFVAEDGGIVGPYLILVKALPFLGDFRVPTRFFLIVLFCLSLIIPILIKPLFKKINTKKAFLFGGLCLLILAEYSYMPPVTPKNVVKIPRGDEVPEVYHWLSKQEGDFAIIELPLAVPTTQQARRMYYSTYNWKRTVNGYNGYYPKDYLGLEKDMFYFPDQKSLQKIESLGLKYIVIHFDDYSKKDYDASPEELADNEKLQEVTHFGHDYVYTLSP